MQKKERYQIVLAYFLKNQPPVETELIYHSDFELLVAVVLSAQCTDKRINEVTPALFKRFPTAEAMAQATEEDVLFYIRSVSYPNNKAKHLVGLAKGLVKNYYGKVPEKFEDLITLPGVGRKTANVITAILFNQPSMAVDTHVYRVSRRLGLADLKANTPYKVELELKKQLPIELISKAHFWLIYHGRYVCKARKPLCDSCGLQTACKYAQRKKII